MNLQGIDWIIIGIFLVMVILIGVVTSRKAGDSSANFFLGGRTMPWWLLGVSMVACTFSCDTPNLVTSLVRGEGVAGNWAWWAFLITGMVTVFIYAQLWRRSRVMTDLGFYELRYSGKSAAFIRGFRALYLGIFFNCLIMGSVTLAAIKIGQVIFGVDPWVAVVCGSAGVVIYATMGGIKSCIWADFFQYSVAMFGAIYAAVVAVRQPEVGGLSNLLHNADIVSKINWLPDFNNWLSWVPLLLIPIAVQWWSVWYPGAEPGGGGYIAQRMLAAKDEKNAIGATMFFNFMHYAMRPWPWIIVALASIICYPSLAQIKVEFPSIDPTYLKPDIAYPVMIAKLGPGLLGLVVASLIAAYMSTIGTHLNWGSSYAVNDFYKRFVRKEASQKEMVMVGRACTVILMVIAGTISLTILQDAGQAFKILLLSGAGTGGIYLLRWFWWRINAWTEIVAMVVATIVAIWLVLYVGNDGTLKWYVGSSAVANKVMRIDDASLASSISAEVNSAKAMHDKLKKDVRDKVLAWRKARKVSPLSRDRARLVYDQTFQKQKKYDDSKTVIALLKSKYQLKYKEVMKTKEELAGKDGKPGVLAENNLSYPAAVAKFNELQAAKKVADDKLKAAQELYGQALKAAQSYNDAPLVAARKALVKAEHAATMATDVYKRFFAKYGKTIVLYAGDTTSAKTAGKAVKGISDKANKAIAGVLAGQKPVWYDKFNSFISKFGADSKAIVVDGSIYVYEAKVPGMEFPVQLIICVFIVTVVWILTTLVTAPADKKTLRSFYKLCHPGGPGWRKVVEDARADGQDIDEHNAIGDWKLPIQILCVFLGCITIYSSLFSVGNFVYGNMVWGFVLAAVALVSVIILFQSFGKIGVESETDRPNAQN